VAFRRRLRRLFLLLALGMAVVWLRALQLQVIEGDDWAAEARKKRERVLVVEAPRGRIVDRDGRVLAVDRPVFQLVFVGWEWKHRGRLRCTGCGQIHHYDVARGPRQGTCPCGEPDATLEPLPLPDPSPLETLLELPSGELARRAEARMVRIEELVRARRRRLESDGRPEFLAYDEERLYRADLLHRPYVVVSRVPEESVRLIELDQEDRYRGFRVRTVLRRYYPPGGPPSQLLGYVSVVQDEEELEALRRRYARNVSLDTRVGRSGLEKGLEELLMGRFGHERQARDGDGDFTRVVRAEPPQAGKQVRLALTVEACARAHAALQQHGKAVGYHPQTLPSGGFVAMYADSGEIVAWAEMPQLDVTEELDRMFSDADEEARFDPSVGQWMLPDGVDPPAGETVDEWRSRLTKPAPRWMSRVSQIAVEPGSTFKVFIGLGLLDGLRQMEPGTWLPIPGDFGCTRQRMTPGCHVHPDVDFVGAICVSCNRYFALSLRGYPEWWRVYRRTVPALLLGLGFGRPTGVDVWGETGGVFLRDYVDFDPRQVAHEACVAVREAAGASAGEVAMRTMGAVPHVVAGRDPARLRSLLEVVLKEALGVAGGAGRVGLSLEPGAPDPRDERIAPLSFEVFARAHPEGPAPRPPDLALLRQRVAELGGPLEAEVRPQGVFTLAFTLRYHERIGRPPGAPLVILDDDGRNVAIGQGPVSVTPLQMVRGVAALANGGRLVTPHVALEADGVPLNRVSSALALDPRDVDLVRAGMREVVEGAHGTARDAGWGAVPAEVYGKTGTAQVGSWWVPGERPAKGPWHHWFVGFAEAPGFRPLAFACVLHSRSEGGASLTAAKAAREFLSWWFTSGPDAR